ncbi:hypothetical protein WJ0W_003503 [Paenibacillus melissococcoides]|uniref:Uncharacterized protein n=1 Tax=Paenibacillus melissococcoides TaxID=2912268 RepID=A0ABN8U5B2_9BACL|nr:MULTISPECIES: hypothetical protein [Paenibacillus]MEB9895644.1 hypothetical protein [Bacillus cereus]CAH8246268.1 hypothetical protein WJ0W_003503 [Paenibacillus melissococcoides]CAH8713461.1 hypothetical protein WDD9_003576 [Paenibacillus melissococcoides]CAH8714195.1 hypothetical protein HTL2_003879 [Paenibacillus melissococcoides]GIO80909.1 hypothetical protein J6TS7_45190 [Paenibacillus dendritiformis]
MRWRTRLQLIHVYYITSVDGDVNSQAIYRQIKDSVREIGTIFTPTETMTAASKL